MTEIKFDSSLFSIYAGNMKKQISLLDNFQLPPGKSWILDWNTLNAIAQKKESRKWNQLNIYRELLAIKNSPVIYYFNTDMKGAKQIFQLFESSKKESSRTRITKGVGNKGFYNISHVPKTFNEGNCIYVGSRKKNVHQRMIQHLGYGSGRTGALHLAKVFSSTRAKPKIIFHYHILDKKYFALTEHIECVVQTSLNPFIGKKLLND